MAQHALWTLSKPGMRAQMAFMVKVQLKDETTLQISDPASNPYEIAYGHHEPSHSTRPVFSARVVQVDDGNVYQIQDELFDDMESAVKWGEQIKHRLMQEGWWLVKE